MVRSSTLPQQSGTVWYWILQMTVPALTEEFKCAKVRLEMTLVESHNKCQQAAPVWKTGSGRQRKLQKMQRLPFVTVILWGKYSMGEEALLSSAPPTMHKAAPAQLKLVVNEVQKQEERMRWESVEQCKIGW
ncbi:UNVERIFIED_CONTAM: hypothetical protein FKN15_038938 [Acipenser sinensis]